MYRWLKRDLVAIARKREKEGEWGKKSAPDTKRHTVRVEQCTINAFFPLQESRGLVALYLSDRPNEKHLSEFMWACVCKNFSWTIRLLSLQLRLGHRYNLAWTKSQINTCIILNNTRLILIWLFESRLLFNA